MPTNLCKPPLRSFTQRETPTSKQHEQSDLTGSPADGPVDRDRSSKPHRNQDINVKKRDNLISSLSRSIDPGLRRWVGRKPQFCGGSLTLSINRPFRIQLDR